MESYTHYLKCRYSDGMFPHEVVINLRKERDLNWMFVNKEDVIPYSGDVNAIFGTGEGGLVRCVLLGPPVYSDPGKDHEFVGINDTGEFRRSTCHVLKEDLLTKEEVELNLTPQ